MENIIIILSTTLIPAVITLISTIFTLLTKYKKEIIIAQKDTADLQRIIKTMEENISKLETENKEYLRENIELKNRVVFLEAKIEEMSNKKTG